MDAQSKTDSLSNTSALFEQRLDDIEHDIATLKSLFNPAVTEKYHRFVGNILWKNNPSTVQKSQISISLVGSMTRRGWIHISPNTIGPQDAGHSIFFSSTKLVGISSANSSWAGSFRELGDLKRDAQNLECIGFPGQPPVAEREEGMTDGVAEAQM